MLRRVAAIGVLFACFVTSTNAKDKHSDVIPDSARGFDAQYQSLFSAWSKGDKTKFESSVAEFAIPAKWFVDTFGPDTGSTLGAMYGEQFQDFQTHISRSFGMAAKVGMQFMQQSGFRGPWPSTLLIQTSLDRNVDPKPAPKPPPESIQPLPPIQHYSIQSLVRTQGPDQKLTSWMDSFVYIDGKFRFLGRGAYPFWDAARIRLADPFAKPGEQTGGKLIKRVEPEYPESAKDQRVEGCVKARLTIATDGTVKEVEITEGPPALVDAARAAFSQWQYTPFMNCGKPVEMRSMEHVKFALPK